MGTFVYLFTHVIMLICVIVLIRYVSTMGNEPESSSEKGKSRSFWQRLHAGRSMIFNEARLTHAFVIGLGILIAKLFSNK